MQKGACKKIKDNRGRTPYDLAVEKNKTSILEMLKDRRKCNMCITKMPLEKVEKNYSNMAFFYSVHFLVEFFMIYFSAPCKYKYFVKNNFFYRCNYNIFLYLDFISYIRLDIFHNFIIYGFRKNDKKIWSWTFSKNYFIFISFIKFFFHKINKKSN